MTNPLEHYIASQPDRVGACYEAGLAGFAVLAESPPRSLALVGSGSSFNALLAVVPQLRCVCDLQLLNPLDYIDALDRGEHFDQTIVLSQSGASETSVAAVQRAQRSGAPVLVVTADRESAIAACGAQVVSLEVGAETIGPKTVGYTGSVATLLGLATVFGAAPRLSPATAKEALASVLKAMAEDVARAAADFDDIDHLLVAARNGHVATATEGALKIAEITGLPAAAYPLEELLHGRLNMLRTHSRAVVIAASSADLKIACQARAAVAELGLTLRVIDLTAAGRGDMFIALPQAPAPLDLLTAVVPFQMLANAMALKRNMDPWRMPYPDLSDRLGLKVTATA